MTWLAALLTVLTTPLAPASLGHDEIFAVLQERKPALRRVCFEPLEAGVARDASFKVRVTLRVDANGFVTSSVATGAEALPTLAPCVGRELGRWRFPLSDDETVMSIPFVFTARPKATP